ncbi:MAG: hypothetical protein ACFFBP_11335 [Promethearchaeota archaeon]
MIVEEINLNEFRNKLLKTQVDKAAQNLIKKALPFDELCWELAELQLIIDKGTHNYNDHEVSSMEDKIFNAELTYEEICWLIAYLTVFLRIQKLYP